MKKMIYQCDQCKQEFDLDSLRWVDDPFLNAAFEVENLLDGSEWHFCSVKCQIGHMARWLEDAPQALMNLAESIRKEKAELKTDEDLPF